MIESRPTAVHIKHILFVLFFLVVTASYRPFIHETQPQKSDQFVLKEGGSIGQTFVAAHAGLEGVQFFLDLASGGDGYVVMHIRSGPEAVDDLRLSRMPVNAVTERRYYNFNFPSLPGSQREYYYALLEIEGEGEVQVLAGPGDAYLEGSLYQNQDPVDAQATFRLSYNLLPATLGLARQTFTWIGFLLIGLAVFVLPGWGLFTWIWPGWSSLDWPSKLGLSAGLSLAIYPLFLLWTDLIGVHLGRLYAWLPFLAGLAAIAWRIRSLRRGKTHNADDNASTFISRLPAFSFHYMALLLVLAVIVGTRFWAIRALEAPMWGDSVQHSVIAQLLIDNNGLFNSWTPYTPYQSLTVQYGYPAAVAVYSWFSESSSIKAALVVGQIANILAVFTIYPLALRVSRGSHWAATGAVLVAGLFTPVPAIYVNWGRYAQLAGQAILPVSLWMLWDSLSQPLNKTADYEQKTQETLWNIWKYISWPKVVFSGLALAGMTLTYYRMPFYYTTFVFALLTTWGLSRWRIRLKQWLPRIIVLSLVAGFSIISCLPWGLRVMGGHLASMVEAGMTSSSPLEAILVDYRVWSELYFYIPKIVVLLALAGLVWGLLRKQLEIAAIGLWVIGLASLVASSLTRVPGTNMMQNFAVVIALYIPVGILTGWLFGDISGYKLFQGKTGQVALAAIVAAAAFWGGWEQRDMADPDSFAMVTRPDVRAAAWIVENLPSDSRFLVEGFRIYNGSTAVGSDAGWWLPLLAHGENTMPPQYALMNEVPIRPDYNQNVVNLVAHLESTSAVSNDSLSALCEWGITHVYIGQGQGKVSAEKIQLFKPDQFISSPFFRQIYHQDRVYIFSLDFNGCEKALE